MKIKREIISLVLFLLCLFILFYSLFVLKGKEYYFASLAIILSGVILFVSRFESRSPSISELTVIAVMCALGVVSRISFFFLPEVKPMAAFVIITGISMGAESGFITGALCAFVSNFYFGQGSWTPFQMFALGLVGFFAGVIFRRLPAKKTIVALYGLLSVVIIYGAVVDINTLYFTMGENTWNSILFVYGASLPFNLIYGISTAVFLVLLQKPVLSRLTRIKIKYNLIEKEKEKQTYE